MAEHSIAQAAALLGVSTDTVRRRIKRGELPARRTGDGRLLVELPEAAPGAPLEAFATPPRDASGADPDGLRAELEHTRALLEEVRRSRDGLQATIETLTRQLDAAQQAQQQDAKERAELRIMLAQAQAQLGRLLPAPSSDEVSRQRDAQQEPTPIEGEASNAPRRWWWPWGRA